jgi:hypothetical protein
MLRVLRRLLRFLAIATVLLTLGFCAAGLIGIPVTKRFLLEVTADIDGRHLSGSAVWEVTVTDPWVFNPLSQGGTTARTVVRGEAIALRLSHDEAVFVLRREADYITYIGAGNLLRSCRQFTALASFEGGCEVKNRLELVTAAGDLSSTAMPAIGFGAGGPVTTGRARNVRLLVSTTDAPITIGLEEEFPWILGLAKPGGNPARLGDGTFSAERLYTLDFTTEAGGGP